mmetsp:Transcript_26750/g.60938  ORF Transcript_26750/g.60938 Transcript_26750/m.60938 type:complete len:281 (-) Transcript_26750:314-1156(-)
MLVRPVLLPARQQWRLGVHDVSDAHACRRGCRCRLGGLGIMLGHLCVLLLPHLRQLSHNVAVASRALLPTPPRLGGRCLRLVLPLDLYVRGRQAVVVHEDQEVDQHARLHGCAFTHVTPVAVHLVLPALEQWLELVADFLGRRNPAKESLPLVDSALHSLLTKHRAISCGSHLRLCLLCLLFASRALVGRLLGLGPVPRGGLGLCMPVVLVVLLSVKLLRPTFWQVLVLLLSRWRHPAGLFDSCIPVVILAVLLAEELLPALRELLVLSARVSQTVAGLT